MRNLLIVHSCLCKLGRNFAIVEPNGGFVFRDVLAFLWRDSNDALGIPCSNFDFGRPYPAITRTKTPGKII